MRAIVIGIGVVALGAGGAAEASGATVNWFDDGTFQTNLYEEAGVRVTGSGLMSFDFSGVGVVGGVADNTVDPGEYLEFEAIGPNVFASAEFNSGFTGGLDGGDFDSFTIEGFLTDGTSVGTFDYQGLGLAFFIDDDWVARLGAGPLNKIRLAATGDRYRISAMDFTFVPAPGAAALLGLGALGALRRRR